MIKKKIIYRNMEIFKADFLFVSCLYKDICSSMKGKLTKKAIEVLRLAVDEHGDDPESVGVQFPMPGGGSVIWAKPGYDSGTVVHECLHATMNLMKNRGIHLSDESEEIFAYVLEDLYNAFIK